MNWHRKMLLYWCQIIYAICPFNKLSPSITNYITDLAKKYEICIRKGQKLARIVHRNSISKQFVYSLNSIHKHGFFDADEHEYDFPSTIRTLKSLPVLAQAQRRYRCASRTLWCLNEVSGSFARSSWILGPSLRVWVVKMKRKAKVLIRCH